MKCHWEADAPLLVLCCRYLRSNAASSAGNATPFSDQRMNACSSPSSAARSLSGSVSRAPVPVLVVHGRSQSVAPPLPRVHAAAASNPVAAYDETGMKSGRVSERRNVENVTEDQQPIELDPSLRDVLDGQMLSSRSRLLAMELKVGKQKTHADSHSEVYSEEISCGRGS